MSMTRTVKADYLNVTDNVVKDVVLGAKQVVTIKAPFDTTTNNRLECNYTMPSRAIVPNDWAIQGTLRLKVVATAGSGLLAGQGLFAQTYGSVLAPRNHPFNWFMENVQIKINNSVSTTNTKRLMPAFSKAMSNKDACEYIKGCPSLPVPQAFYKLSDGVGTSQNPLAGAETQREDFVPNGSWDGVKFYTSVGPDVVGDPVVAGDGSAQGWIDLILPACPILATPLMNPGVGVAKTYISNVDTINVLITTDNKYDMCFASSNPNIKVSADTVANVWGQASAPVFLTFQSYYPHDYMPLPKESKLLNITYDIKSQNMTAPANVGDIIQPSSTSLFQFDSYADTFIWFMSSKPYSSMTTSDSYSFLNLGDQFTININGNNAIWNGYTHAEIYDILKKYTRLTYSEYIGKVAKVAGGLLQHVDSCGPVYMAQSGVDIPVVEGGVVAGMPYRTQIQFTNLQPVAVEANQTPELVVIAVNTGEITILPSTSKQTQKLVAVSDVGKAISDAPSASFESELPPSQEGGKRSLKKLARAMVGNARSAGMAPSAGARSGGRIQVDASIPGVGSRF